MFNTFFFVEVFSLSWARGLYVPLLCLLHPHSLTYIPYLQIVCVVMYWKIGQFKDSETLSGLKGSICFIKKALRRKFVMNLYIK